MERRSAMKKVIKNLLAGVGIAAIGFVSYVLWDERTKAKEQALKEEKAAKARADAQAFIERRKVRAAAKAANVQAQGKTNLQTNEPSTDNETAFAQEETAVEAAETAPETDGKEAAKNAETEAAAAEESKER